jgi:uncharacterized membrane protein YeaQ/YmgE (transglycosylase-associated protein family)
MKPRFRDVCAGKDLAPIYQRREAWESSRSSFSGCSQERSPRRSSRATTRAGSSSPAIIGIVGALLGGFIAAAVFDADPLDEFFDISTWITAIVGSIVLLLVYRLVVDRGGHGRTLRT